MPANRIVMLIVALLTSLLIAPPALMQEDAPVVERLVPEVLSVRDHATDAYTQGLILHDGLLYESTGQYGASSLRQVDPETGEVLLYLPIPQNYFAEGLALVDDALYMLTWREQTAFRFNLSAFTEQAPLEADTFRYEGEGWGLCYDGEALWMSNGSDTLVRRDPATFEIIDEVQVTLDGVPLSQMTSAGEVVVTPDVPASGPTPTPVTYQGRPIHRLNELECVDESIYANAYITDYIFRIDKATGAVTGWIDAAGLLTEEERPGTDVLNGIVYLPETDTFIITGKWWPKMFEVRFVPAEIDT